MLKDVQRFDVVSLDEGAPRRGLPLILLSALTFWSGAACVFFLSPFPEQDACMVWAGACCVAAGGLGLLGIKPQLRVAAFMGAFAALGCAIGCCACLQLLSGQAAAEAGVMAHELRALQDSSKTDYGHATICEAQGEDGHAYKVRLLTGDDESFLAGDVMLGNAKLSPFKERSRRFYETQGVSAQIKASGLKLQPAEGILGMLRIARAQTIERIQEHGGSSAPLFCAIVCGYRQPMANSPLYDQFKTCGLAHLVAVSGAHTSIVLMLLVLVLKLLRSPRWLSALLSVLFVVFYLVFAGMPVSAIRSATMAVLALLSFFANRRQASLSSIGLCVIAFLVVDPSACLSVSLFLSAGSTLGIVLFSGLFASWLPTSQKAVRTLVVDPLSLTLASNVVTLPFSAALFSQLSLIAPLANVLAAPLFALCCMAGLMACVMALLLPALSAPLIGLASLGMGALAGLVSALSLVPFASIACSLDPVPMLLFSLVISCALFGLWPSPSKRLALALGGAMAAALIGLFVSAFVPKGDAVVALDVGQGDAILIRSQGSTVLIDTGNSDARLREALGAERVYQLDAVIITHPDDDHCASLSSLGGYVDVKRICFAGDVWECGCSKCERLISLADACAPFAEKTALGLGDELRVGAFSLEVVWPEGFTDAGGNADSLCLLGELDCDADGTIDWLMLFTGDAESEELDGMLAAGRVGDIDLLKVGHHGSKVSLTADDVAKIHPEVALISVGADNRYGHPSQEVLDCLDSVGCEVLRTDERGSVSVTFTTDAMNVTSSK